MAPIPPTPAQDISILHPKVLLLSAGITTSLFLDTDFILDMLEEYEHI